MSDRDVDSVFGEADYITPPDPLPDDPSQNWTAREMLERSMRALVESLDSAKSPSDRRQAANALLKFLQSQGVEWVGGEREEWMPPPEYNASLTYHLALLFGEGGLSEAGTDRTELAHAATRASAAGYSDGPVFREGVDQWGALVGREEGYVYTPAGRGGGIPVGWKGGSLVEGRGRVGTPPDPPDDKTDAP